MTAMMLGNGGIDRMGAFESGKGRTLKKEDWGLEQREESRAEERHTLAKL